MNSVLEAVRSKYPAYRGIPDNELISAIGTKFPAYLKKEDFKTDFMALQPSMQPVMAGESVQPTAEAPLPHPMEVQQAAEVQRLKEAPKPDVVEIIRQSAEESTMPFGGLAIPKIPERPGQGTVETYAKAAVNSLTDLIDFTHSPAGFMFTVGGKAAPLLTSLVGAGWIAQQTGPAAAEAGRASVEGTPQQKAQAYINATMLPIFAAVGAKHGVNGIRTLFKEISGVELVPSGPQERGNVLADIQEARGVSPSGQGKGYQQTQAAIAKEARTAPNLDNPALSVLAPATAAAARRTTEDVSEAIKEPKPAPAKAVEQPPAEPVAQPEPKPKPPIERTEDASQKPSPESLPEHEVRARVGEEAPLRQQGQTPAPQGGGAGGEEVAPATESVTAAPENRTVAPETATTAPEIKPLADTPLMRDHAKLKSESPPGSLVAVRLGDFFEFFGEDAVTASKVLDEGKKYSGLTKRNGIQMYGVPYHAAETYLNKLRQTGHTIAIADVTEAPTSIKPSVRKITEILKPEPKPPAAETKAPMGEMIPPVEAVKKVTKKVIQVANEEGKRSAEEIKSELVKRIEDAIKTAPTEEEVRTGSYTKVTGETVQEQSAKYKITISIPDDGEFTVWNTKEHLESLLKRAKRIQVTGSKTKIPTAKKGIQSYDPDETANTALKIYGDPKSAITHIETQAKLEDLDSAQRYNLERAAEILRDQLPENVLDRKIVEKAEEVETLDADLAVAKKNLDNAIGAKKKTKADVKFIKSEQIAINQAEGRLNRTKSELEELKKQRQSIGAGAQQAGKGPGTGAGPGTPSAKQGPDPQAQIEQLSASFKNIESQKVPFLQKIKDAFSAGRKITQAKEAVGQALDGLKASGDFIRQKFTGFKSVDDMLKAKGELSAELEKRGWRVREFVKTVEKAIPDKRKRAAISKWVDAGGDAASLKQGLAETKPQFKQAYQDALDLKGDDLVAAQNIRNYFEARLQEAIDAGVLDHGIEDYIHRIYEDHPKAMKRAMAYVQSGILSKNPALAKQRFYRMDWEAEKAGLTPVQDFLPRIAQYESSLSKAIAAREFIKKATTMKAKDGRPVIGVKGVGIPIEDKFGIREATLIKPSINPHAEVGTPEYRGDYVNREYPALSKWKWVASDTAGQPIMLQGDVAIHPDFVGRIDALLEPSRLRYGAYAKITKPMLAIGSTVKQTMLDLSFFHQVQIAVHASEHRVFPWNVVKEINFEDPKVEGLLRGGVTLGGDFYASHYGEGLVGRSLTRHIPGLGPIMESYHSWLFQDFIPRVKMTMALHALERNRGRYAKDLASGKMSEDALHQLTAEQANAAFGELNYITLERSKTAQDMARLVLLAPDFLEARARFAGQAFTKYGTEQRVALLLGALTMYTLARIANKALDDQYHFEPENLFSVVHNGRSYGLRTVQGDILHLVEKPVQFWMSRLNPVYGRTFLEMVTGRDYFGRKRSAMDQVWDAVSTLAPISLRTSRERNLSESMLNAFGVTARRWSDVDDAYKLAQAWKTAHGVGAKGEFIYDSTKDPMRPLKIALSFGDEAGAAQEIKKLLSSGQMTRSKLNEYFNRYATAPFTGSAANDRKWIATLSEDQRKTVEGAKDHKKNIRDLYRRSRDQYDAANPGK